MNKQLGVALCMLAFFFLVFVIRRDKPWMYPIPQGINSVQDGEKLNEAIERLKKLSLKANNIQEKYQQLICETIQHESTSTTGGWCSRAFKTGHVTDEKFAKALETLFARKRVIGLGDGPGGYRKHLLAKGVVQQYDSYDGSPFISNYTNSQVNFLDLTLEQYWLPVYDWVLCTEVLEHISSRYEDVVLDNIDRAAGEGVVVSWAVPGQGGFQHINSQSPEYVVKVFEARGFKFDAEMTKFLSDNSQFSWIKKNIKVFRRRPITAGQI